MSWVICKSNCSRARQRGRARKWATVSRRDIFPRVRGTSCGTTNHAIINVTNYTLDTLPEESSSLSHSHDRSGIHVSDVAEVTLSLSIINHHRKHNSRKHHTTDSNRIGIKLITRCVRFSHHVDMPHPLPLKSDLAPRGCRNSQSKEQVKEKGIFFKDRMITVIWIVALIFERRRWCSI